MRRFVLRLLFAGLVGCTGVFFQPQGEHMLTPDSLGLFYTNLYNLLVSRKFPVQKCSKRVES